MALSNFVGKLADFSASKSALFFAQYATTQDSCTGSRE